MRADRFEPEDPCPAEGCGHLLSRHNDEGCTVGWNYSSPANWCMCNLRIAQ
jgi:hypothetical protein